MPQQLSFEELTAQIMELIDKARSSVARKINEELLLTYWEIGRVIVEHEQEAVFVADLADHRFDQIEVKGQADFLIDAVDRDADRDLVVMAVQAFGMFGTEDREVRNRKFKRLFS